MSAENPHNRPGRIVWATLAFTLGFALLIVVVSRWYLLPALEVFQEATASEKRQLSAHSTLLLAILLFILVAGLLLTFRFGRYFIPRAGEPQKPTQHVDAWAEAGKRVSAPPRDDSEREDE